MTRIKVFHLEDYQIMREGLKTLVRGHPVISLVGEAQNFDQLTSRMKELEVDVLLTDIYLDAMRDLSEPNGFEICKWIRDVFPKIRIVGHSVYDDADTVTKIFHAGATGFVSKNSTFEELVRGIEIVASGRFYISLDTVQGFKNVEKFLAREEPYLVQNHELFSKREREVLELLGQGCSSSEIGGRLFIAPRTVETHRKNMMERVKVRNIAELIAFAVSVGIIRGRKSDHKSNNLR